MNSNNLWAENFQSIRNVVTKVWSLFIFSLSKVCFFFGFIIEMSNLTKLHLITIQQTKWIFRTKNHPTGHKWIMAANCEIYVYTIYFNVAPRLFACLFAFLFVFFFFYSKIICEFVYIEFHVCHAKLALYSLEKEWKFETHTHFIQFSVCSFFLSLSFFFSLSLSHIVSLCVQ